MFPTEVARPFNAILGLLNCFMKNSGPIWKNHGVMPQNIIAADRVTLLNLYQRSARSGPKARGG